MGLHSIGSPLFREPLRRFERDGSLDGPCLRAHPEKAATPVRGPMREGAPSRGGACGKVKMCIACETKRLSPGIIAWGLSAARPVESRGSNHLSPLTMSRLAVQPIL